MANEEGIYPAALKRGDTVAIVAPSLRLNHVFPEAVNRAKAFLESQSFRVVEIFTPMLPTGRADAIKARVDEIHRAFSDPEIKAVLCAIGGWTASQLVRHIDYNLIRDNPKIFCGFSDITVLHCAIFQKTGLRTFYGPAAISELAEYPAPLQLTREDFTYVLSKSARRPLGVVPKSKQWAPKMLPFFEGGSIKTERKTVTNQGWRWLRTGTARGRIFGGSLSSLLHMRGTEFWPDFTDRILLLETSMGDDSSKGPLTNVIEAQLTDLGNNGVFEKTNGLVVGRPFGMDEKAKREFDQVILDEVSVWAGNRDYPILVDVDVGHTAPNLTFPLNALVELEKSAGGGDGQGRFEILEAGTM